MNAPMLQSQAPLSQLQSSAQHFLARYDRLKAELPASTIRAAAAQAFARTGLPGPREEEWRYTPLRPLAELSLDAAVRPASLDALLARLPAIAAPRLVFMDGKFQPGASTKLSYVKTGAPAWGTLADPVAHKLVALNSMLTEDGLALDVPAGMDAGSILLVSLGSGAINSFHPRHSISLGEGASLTLIEIALGDGCYLNNPVLSATVAASANFTHLRMQQDSAQAFHMSTVYVDVAAAGTYDSFALTLGARLARMEVHATLGGPNAAAHLNAAQLLGGNQHADFTTVVQHAAPNTSSRQTVKNVLTGKSHGVFQGKIEVLRIAQKTDGYQMNQALLLSPDAEMNAKPQLEIYADDVKCSHGATIGELDGEQLFYLRSRGIPESSARTMLVRAFLAEALDPIAHDGARAAMEAAIDAWWDHQPA